MNIPNPQLVDKPKKYGYDKLSMENDKLFTLKIVKQ